MPTFLEFCNMLLNDSFHVYLFAAVLLFCGSWNKRSNFWFRIIPLSVAYVVLPYFGLYNISWLIIGDWFNLTYIVIFFLLLILLFVCFDLKINELLFFGMAAYAIQHLIFRFTLIIYMLIIDVFPIEFSPSTRSLISTMFPYFQLLIGIATNLVIYFAIARHVDKEELLGLKKKRLLVVFSATIGVVYVLSMLVSLAQVSYLFYSMYAVTCCLLLLGIQFGLFEQNKLEKKNIMAERILHISQKQHELSKENIDLINRKCHDMRHQIATLQLGGNLDAHKDSFNEIERAINIYDSVVKTGNDALDIALTEKSLVCEKYDIRLACIVDGEKLSFMDAIDIFTLLGNALENAISAVKELSDGDKKTINLNINEKNGFICIHMDNYLIKEPEFLDGLPVTSHADKRYHGFGMSSIAFIAKKYNGTISIKTNNNLFQLNILFPYNHKK